MNEDARDPIQRAARVLPFGVSAIGVAAILTAGVLLVSAGEDAFEHEHLQLYHLQSEVIAQQIEVDTGRLRQSVSGADGDSTRALVAVIRESVLRIAEIQDEFGHHELASSVGRLRQRFDRVAKLLSRGDSSEIGSERQLRAIGSLSLAAHQLERMHLVDAKQSLSRLHDHAREQLVVILLAALAIALISFAVSRWLVVALRRGFEREQAALQARHAELAHSQKIEALGRLSGGIAHDFNNLLTVILGNVEILLAELDKDSPLEDSASEIEHAAVRAAALTRQLLSFSRQDVIEVQSVDLNAVIRESESMLTRLLREDIVLRTELDEELGPVTGDPTQLQQVVLNLVLNARDALPEGGTLTVETGRSSRLPANAQRGALEAADASGVEGFARLTVRDTGMGIAPGIRDRLFDPYFTTKPKGAGTGLGLSTVSAIVEDRGGAIVVETEEGVGSRFDVYLPLGSEEEVADVEATSFLEEEATGTILVAEDQRAVRRLAKRILSEAGFEVLTAADGEEALELCRRRSEPIDLILTDIVMPNVKGFEVAERAKDTHPEARILFMSGYTDDEDLLRDLRDAPERLLRKPFSRDQLLEHVRGALATKRPG